MSQVHKMFVLLFILFPISLTLSCKSPPVEVESGNRFTFYVLVGEPIFLTCSLEPATDSGTSNVDIIWFKNGSEIEISRDTQERIHQVNNKLKFIPARLEDKGFYSCVFRNDTGCWKTTEELDVFQYEKDSCYKYDVLYSQQAVGSGALIIECRGVSEYVDIHTARFQWFKDCQPLNVTSTNKYIIARHELIISYPSAQDKGVYSCETLFTYNGTDYNISRTIDLSFLESPLISKPVILTPTDNFIEATLGAPLIITCKVLFIESMSVFWLYNESYIDEYSGDNRVVEGEEYATVAENGQKVKCKNITFSSVKEEDYDKKFTCYADSAADSEASVTLKRPAPNYQTFLIAFFCTLACLIIMAIVIIKVFKVEIVLWYRSSCCFRPPRNDDKMYDAYIMYPKKNTGIGAYDMDLFVLKVLPEVLEQQCSYRLFIIGRDDIPGQAVTDLVDEAISQSRRLIIVLGNISKEDCGEDFERKIAMYDALIRNKIKVILIELEKITDYTNMPESVKYIKQKQGVVQWKQEFTEASLSPNTRFWKNVRYRMPPPMRHTDNELRSIHTEDSMQ